MNRHEWNKLQPRQLTMALVIALSAIIAGAYAAPGGIPGPGGGGGGGGGGATSRR